MSERDEKFFENLRERGLFTRDYDALCAERLPRIANELHSELCNLDAGNWRTGWASLTLVDFINAWVDAGHGYRRLVGEKK